MEAARPFVHNVLSVQQLSLHEGPSSATHPILEVSLDIGSDTPLQFLLREKEAHQLQAMLSSTLQSLGSR